MNSIASLAQLPRGLSALRNRLVEISAAEDQLRQLRHAAIRRINELAEFECRIQNDFLFPAVAHWGDDFDGWWRDLPNERVTDAWVLVNQMNGHWLSRPQFEHRIEAMYIEAYHIIDNARGAA